MPVPESEVRDLLAAIAAALRPPYPAELEGWAARQKLVNDRASHLAGYLSSLTEGPAPTDLAGHARNLRELAAGPLPYQPEGGQS